MTVFKLINIWGSIRRQLVSEQRGSAESVEGWSLKGLRWIPVKWKQEHQENIDFT
jgi:hypothetical protein